MASAIHELVKNAGYMTASEMRNRAGFLSNCCWCRHWLHLHSSDDGEHVMAIQCRDSDGKPIEILGLKSDGFIQDKDFIYLIKRRDIKEPDLKKRIEELESALKIIHAWAGVKGALVPEHVRKLCAEKLGI